jgi:hypothetical protein
VAEIAKTQLGRDVVELMKSGVITENTGRHYAQYKNKIKAITARLPK